MPIVALRAPRQSAYAGMWNRNTEVDDPDVPPHGHEVVPVVEVSVKDARSVKRVCGRQNLAAEN